MDWTQISCVEAKAQDSIYMILFLLSTHPVCLFVGVFNPLTFKVITNMCDPITILLLVFSQFSRSVVSNSLWPHGMQHTGLPCPSTAPGAYSNSGPSRQWCHPTISSYVIRFSSCPQSFPASGSFPVSRFFTSGGQSICVSPSASVLPMNNQDWFSLGLTGWISLPAKGLTSLFQHHSWKVSTLWCSAFFVVQFSHP